MQVLRSISEMSRTKKLRFCEIDLSSFKLNYSYKSVVCVSTNWLSLKPELQFLNFVTFLCHNNRQYMYSIFSKCWEAMLVLIWDNKNTKQLLLHSINRCNLNRMNMWGTFNESIKRSTTIHFSAQLQSRLRYLGWAFWSFYSLFLT